MGTLALNNYGSIAVEAGTFNIPSPFSSSGALTLAPGTTTRFSGIGSASGMITNPSTALVEWAAGGSFTLNAGAQLNGSGVYRLSGSTLTLNTDIAVQSLEMASTINGSGKLTVSNTMTWTAGTLGGGNRAIIASNATLTLNNPSTLALDTRTLENSGTTIWTGAGGMILVNAAIITNRPGALFEFRTSPGFSTSGGATSFHNAGTLRKTISTGTLSMGTVNLNNYGTTDIRSGILAVNGGYTPASSSRLNCVLGGTTAGTGYGQLQKSGTITLDGALSVELLPGFSAGTRSGTFSSFAYPNNHLTLTLSNSPNSVILRATEVFAVPAPVLLNPELSGADIKLTWTATSNVTYRLEYLSSLNTNNWSAIAGDVTTLSDTASKLEPLTISNRFYRVRALP